MPDTIPTRTTARPFQATRTHVQGFVPLTLSAERVERLLACLDRHTRATPTQLADALGLTCAAARPLINELCGLGLARPAGGGRRLYERAQTPVQPRLVLDRLRPSIRAYLQGRPALASSVARDLGELPENVAETCKAMHLEGELRGVAVGATFVYSVDPAVTQPFRLEQKDEAVSPTPVTRRRGRITEDLVRKVQAALPPVGHRAGGEVERVAERFGLSPSQVYRALKQDLPSG
ncbi:helix-turn-helix domain-containing protein [Deinococcus aluminii]|uniref:HTH iclR-type domain-containing protein n=1 Tax=Deinococcus aluminii TaxID=1656885 RepID=A0ABP9XIP7_9DEIO